MDESNLAVLVDAKKEYTKQLTNILRSHIFRGFKDLYEESKKYCSDNNIQDKTIPKFQQKLSEIPQWNQDIIITKYNSIICDCDWLYDLLTAVFLSHTRILSSIKINKSKKKIDLVIPKIDHFIHLCYIDLARVFWKTPYLFDDTISSYSYQKNRRDIENTIEDGIIETIRKQLPVKNILKEYLSEDENDKYMEIRNLVKEEIESRSKEQQNYINNIDIDNTDTIDNNDTDHTDDDKVNEKITSENYDKPLTQLKEEINNDSNNNESNNSNLQLDNQEPVNNLEIELQEKPDNSELQRQSELSSNNELQLNDLDLESELEMFEVPELKEVELESPSNTSENSSIENSDENIVKSTEKIVENNSDPNIKKIILEINDDQESIEEENTFSRKKRNYNFFEDSVENDDD